jgi:hypothetical protein
MPRKPPSKETQIKMIRGALASKKTPKHLRPSLQKRLAKLLGMIFLSSSLLYPTSSFAQTPVIIQPTQQTLATLVACNGMAQTYAINNRNQTEHIASVIASGSMNLFSMEIDGIDNQGNVFRLSDIAQGNFGSTGTTIFGMGYYPRLQVSITCTGTSYTLSYSGSSGFSSPTTGVAFASQLDKQLFFSVAANMGQQNTFQTPFGNSSGTLLFNYNSGAIAGSTITVQCQTIVGASTSEQFTFTIANTTAVQTFIVPPAACPQETVVYSSGGAGGLFTLEYAFNPPGAAVNPTLGTYTHITGTTATAVKGIAGRFLNLNVNTAAAGTVSVFDLATAACTGTPATNAVAVITVNATDPSHTNTYNQFLLNGICVKASVAMDLTVGFQ